MSQSIQVRDACDRCHGIKTRCVRGEAGRPVCQRCDRLGLSCSYSPPGQTGRPPGGGRKRKDTQRSTEESTGRQSSSRQGSSKKASSSSQRSRSNSEQHTINVSDSMTSVGALPTTPEASTTILPDMLHILPTSEQQPPPPQLQQHDPQSAFRIDDFAMSPSSWPYISPDMPPFDIDMSGYNDMTPMSPPSSSSTLDLQSFFLNNPTSFPNQFSTSGTSTPGGSPGSASHQQLMQLADLQSKLLVLADSVADAPDSFSMIEEVLIISESFIALFQAIGPICLNRATSSGNNRKLGGTCPKKEANTCQTAIFLLSNCYLNLIHIFETLVAQLQNEQSEEANLFAAGGGTRESMLSIGATRLSMPRQAAAEVHLHLVFRMFDRLASSLGVGYGGGGGGANGGSGANGGMNGTGSEDKDMMDSDGSDSGIDMSGGPQTQSIVSLAGRAVHSLSLLEERMAERRAKARFIIES